MRYKLQLIENNIAIGYLDLGGDAPAMNYQINNINELKDRQAAYSLNISLPHSDNNARLLGHSDIINVLSNAPYKYHNCVLYCDDIVISPLGAVLKLNTIKDDSFEVTIESGLKDLFKVMEDKAGDKIGDPDWRFKWDVDTMAKLTDKDGLAEWLLYTDPKADRVTTINEGLPNDSYAFLRLPSLNYNKLVQEVFAKENYDVVSDLLLDPVAKEIFVTGSKMNMYARILPDEALADFYYPGIQSPPDKEIIASPESVTNWGHGGRVYFGDAQFKAEQYGHYHLHLTLRTLKGLNINIPERPIRVTIKRNFTTIVSEVIGSNRPNQSFVLDSFNDYILSAGEEITVELTFGTGTGTKDIMSVELYFSMEDEPKMPIPGTTLDYVACTSFANRKEIVYNYIRTFGASINIARLPNPTTGAKGLVEIYSFKELYDRIAQGKTLDWTDKYAMTQRTLSFSAGSYARKNIIKQKEYDNEGEKITDTGVFEINNELLADTKELFTLNTLSGKDIDLSPSDPTNTERTAIVNAYDVTMNDAGTEIVDIQLKGGDSHLLTRGGPARKLEIEQGFATIIIGKNTMSLSLHKPVQELITEFYAPVVKMLDNYKSITVELNLSVLDINRLDFYTPVYFQQFGAYFYINKVTNFIAGKLTSVELIKL